MKTVRCINTRNYNLTEGREYTTRQEDDAAEMYTVINDRGLERNYNAELFEDLVTESTIEEILESLNIITNYTGGNITVIVRLSIDGDDLSYNGSLVGQEASNSCGIRDFSNINDLVNGITNNFTENREGRLYQAIFEEVFTSIKNITFTSCGMITFSTNTDANSYEIFNNAITNIADTTVRTVNPNHESDISLWVFAVNGN